MDNQLAARLDDKLDNEPFPTKFYLCIINLKTEFVGVRKLSGHITCVLNLGSHDRLESKFENNSLRFLCQHFLRPY